MPIAQTSRQLINIFYAYERVVWAVLLVTLGLLAGLYVYFVQSTVFNIAAREDGQEQIGSLESEIATLETEYIALSSKLTLARALELGFEEITADRGAFVAMQTERAVSLRADN